MICIHQVFF